MPALAATTVVLQADRLYRTFGDGAQQRVILREVSFGLSRGEVGLLMGPSGSGKSTLLAILSGLLSPESGRVLADDEGRMVDLWALSQKEREHFRLRNMGFIFQGYNLFPALTAVQQLEIVLKLGFEETSREARRKSAEMLDRLGMSNLMHKKPAQLSGGEKQRIAIGRALVKNPTLIFADEPTSALDWENGEQVMSLLRDAAHERGAAAFVVSHDHRMMPYVDVAYHLEHGRLERTELASPAVKEVI